MRNRKSFSSRKGQMMTALNFISDVVMLLVILGTGYMIMDSTALDMVAAGNAAKNMGAAFDIMTITPRDISLKMACPGGYVFDIKRGSIKVSDEGMIGSSYTYYYLLPHDATVNGGVIECDGDETKFIVVEKIGNVDRSVVISAEGSDE